MIRGGRPRVCIDAAEKGGDMKKVIKVAMRHFLTSLFIISAIYWSPPSYHFNVVEARADHVVPQSHVDSPARHDALV